MDRPIFENTWDALRFSFYMECVPAASVSPTLIAIKTLMKSSGKVFDRVESRIHMEGLTPLEVRMQCAMVRSAVTNHLLEVEKHAIWACHGVDETQSKGVKGIASYIQDSTVNKGECLEWIVAAVYSKAVSIREIAKKYEVSKSSVAQDMGRAKAVIDSIEKIACQRLETLFKENGLIIGESCLLCN